MKQDNKEEIKNLVKKHLASYLGVEGEDIDDDDSLTHDLHMRPSDVTDFLETLSQNGVDITKLDMTEIDTVDELIDVLND